MDQRNQREAAYEGRPAIVADYAPLASVPDEMLDVAGNVRPAWQGLIDAFDTLGPHELNARFERADQYLRDAGVFYRKYDGAEGKERAWPLAHVPLLIGDDEWAEIKRTTAARHGQLVGDVEDRVLEQVPYSPSRL